MFILVRSERNIKKRKEPSKRNNDNRHKTISEGHSQQTTDHQYLPFTIGMSTRLTTQVSRGHGDGNTSAVLTYARDEGQFVSCSES